MNQSPDTMRLDWLDELRGIACMLVFIHHAAYSFEEPLKNYTSIYQFWFQHVMPSIDFGVFGVFLFFLISGIVIPASTERKMIMPLEFATRRLYRIYPLYLGSIALAALVYSLPTDTIIANLSIFPKAFGHTEAIGVYWSLQVEVIYYIIFAFFISCGWNRNLLTPWLFFAATGLLTIALTLLRQKIPNIPVSPALSLFCISAGYLHYKLNLYRIGVHPIPSWFSMISIAGLVIFIGFFSRNPKYMDEVAYASSIMLAFILIFNYHLASKRIPSVVRRVLKFLGTISFSVYLIHQPLLYFFQTHKWFDLPVYFSMPAALFFILFTSFATYTALEKPFLRKRQATKTTPSLI